MNLPAIRYTPKAFVDLMLAEPDLTPVDIAKRFGKAPSWIASVLASDAFQQALEPHRHLIADPAITATMEERFRALAIRSTTVLAEKLDAKEISDLTVLKAAEIGVKALGMGQKVAHGLPPPPPTDKPSPAERILAAMDELDRKRQITMSPEGIVDAEVLPK